MAQVEEGGDREKRHISTPLSNFPRDLLHRFNSVDHLAVKLEVQSDDVEELELTLGLSLNGCFWVDPRAKKIKRTSSKPEFVNPVRDEEMGYVMPMACTPLIWTCSLPRVTEEEWRKRKELQTLRRMVARRKHSEKQRNLKVARERNRALSEEVFEDDNYKRSQGVDGNNQAEKGAGAATLNEITTPGCGHGRNGEKGSDLPPQSLSQGSVGYQGISESECQPAQGTKSVDARSPVGANSLHDGEQELPVTSGTRITENTVKIATVIMRNQSNKLVLPANRTKDIGRNLLEDMPCVSTKGEGPSGQRVEGFLYPYRKGEEVRIVCVCHGSFLTPDEFVKHAGGGDVAHPLKHIVVNPSFL